MDFNFDSTEEYVLEDERALLRPLKEDDYGNLLAFAMNEPNLWKYSLLTAASEDDLKSYLELNSDPSDTQQAVVADAAADDQSLEDALQQDVNKIK